MLLLDLGWISFWVPVGSPLGPCRAWLLCWFKRPFCVAFLGSLGPVKLRTHLSTYTFCRFHSIYWTKQGTTSTCLPSYINDLSAYSLERHFTPQNDDQVYSVNANQLTPEMNWNDASLFSSFRMNTLPITSITAHFTLPHISVKLISFLKCFPYDRHMWWYESFECLCPFSINQLVFLASHWKCMSHCWV